MIQVFRKSKLLFSIIILAILSACKNKDADNDITKTFDTTSINTPDTVASINLSNPVALDEVVITFQPEIGKVYHIVNDATFTSTQSAQGKSYTFKTTSNSKLSMTVKNADEESYKVELVQTAAKITMEDSTMKTEYISGKAADNEYDDMIRKVYDCLLNSPMMLTIKKNAEITDVTGMDAIIKKIKGIVGDSIPDEMLQVGDPSENVENLFIILPDSIVKIGDSWDKTIYTVVQGTPMILKNNYTLTDRKNGTAFINMNATVALDKSQIPKEIAEQMNSIKFDGYLKGTAEVDEKSGWTTSAKIEQQVTIEETFQGQAGKTLMEGNIFIRTTE